MIIDEMIFDSMFFASKALLIGLFTYRVATMCIRQVKREIKYIKMIKEFKEEQKRKKEEEENRDREEREKTDRECKKFFLKLHTASRYKMMMKDEQDQNKRIELFKEMKKELKENEENS